MRKTYILMLAFLMIVVLSGCSPTTSSDGPIQTKEPIEEVEKEEDIEVEIEVEKIDSGVVDLRRQQVLAYLTNLSYGNAIEYSGTVSGQNCYHGDQISDQDYLQGYSTMIEDLFDETEEWVGIIGLDYEYDQIYTPEQLSEANKYLIDYYEKGGLVTINWSPHNPWVNDATDIINNPGTSTGNSSPQSEFSLNAVVSLNHLVDDNEAVNKVWMRKLSIIADALEELRNAGVIVLWRPMQEMNGSWMWWGMQSHPNDSQPYIDVWIHMYDYFTNTRGLNNLIWVYSPNSSFGYEDVQNNTSNWNRSVSWAYPGDEYVDIVAGTEYDTDFVIKDYEEYVSLCKPLGMAEVGPNSIDDGIKMDNTLIIERLSEHYPRVAYWVSWHWLWSIIDNDQATELMTDSRTINIGDFDTSLESGNIIENPDTLSLTIHFQNNTITDWDEPSLYYWYTSDGSTVAPDWPGLLMTNDGDSDWYTATIEGVSTSNVLFAASDSSGQTIDLNRAAEGWFVPTGYDSTTGKVIGTWYDTKPE